MIAIKVHPKVESDALWAFISTADTPPKTRNPQYLPAPEANTQVNSWECSLQYPEEDQCHGSDWSETKAETTKRLPPRLYAKTEDGALGISNTSSKIQLLQRARLQKLLSHKEPIYREVINMILFNQSAYPVVCERKSSHWCLRKNKHGTNSRGLLLMVRSSLWRRWTKPATFECTQTGIFRGLCHAQETKNHILQHCEITHDVRCKRHYNVMHLVSQSWKGLARKTGQNQNIH